MRVSVLFRDLRNGTMITLGFALSDYYAIPQFPKIADTRIRAKEVDIIILVVGYTHKLTPTSVQAARGSLDNCKQG